MEIIVSARHFDVSEDVKEYVYEKIGKLSEEYTKLTTARIVLSLERNWQLAEVHISGKHLDLEAHASSADMYASIDEVAEKLERQLRRHLEKMKDHRHSLTLSDVIGDDAEEEIDDVDDVDEIETEAAAV